jgi:Sulfotransferase domain
MTDINCFEIVGRTMPFEFSIDYPEVDTSALKHGKIMFIACFPKSGSTYLSNLLSKLMGYPISSAVQFFGHNEQDIFETRLQGLIGLNAVIQQHAKGTLNNINLMKKYGIKPIVLVRNIYDVIISLSDHTEKESSIYPMGYIHPEYAEMSVNEKREFLIMNVVPWYLDFYLSWRDTSTKMEVQWISYESFFANQFAEMQKIIKFYQLESHCTETTLRGGIAAMSTSGNRLNVGKVGRGETALTDEQKQLIISIARRWKLTDNCLSRIGIEF